MTMNMMWLFSRSKPPKLPLPHQCSTSVVEEKVPSDYDDDCNDDDDYDDYDDCDDYDDSDESGGAQNEESLNRWI